MQEKCTIKAWKSLTHLVLYSWFYTTNSTQVSLECKRFFLKGPPVGEIRFFEIYK